MLLIGLLLKFSKKFILFHIYVEVDAVAYLGTVDLVDGDFTQQEVYFIGGVESADELCICKHRSRQLVTKRDP